MSAPARFSDGQYKNWLKCSLSLIIMKEALHDYTDNEVKKLHGDITQKVSSIPCASSTGNQCGSCSSKNIRLTGKPGSWSINCKNSICDKWLQQILAVHDDPHNPSINWKNGDVSRWPIDCYQVAKIFMPKGQDKTVMMPNDLDAPAILSLFKYCSWFRKDLPNKQIMSDLIDIRNVLLHSGEMRVVDGVKDNWIDLMKQLLSNLNIHVDTQAELEKLKKEDIDIDFRGTEIKVFQRMTSDLASDITTLKEDMASMQKSQSEMMEKVSDSETETTGKVDALKDDMEVFRKSLEQHQDIYDKMVSFFDKNPDIYDKEITEKIQTIDMDVNVLHSNLSRVETELQETMKRVSLLEEKVERLAAETETRKERPETEGLRELKNKTESILRTHRKLEIIITEQANNAEKLLAEKRSIVIKGNPGEGKTYLSRHLIRNEKFEDKRVVLNKPSQWEKVDTDSVAIVVLEDIFGKYNFDPGRFQEWMVHLPTIQEHIDAGELQVIVTTRVDVLSKAYCQRLESLNLFSKELSLTLSSKHLTNSEKSRILKRELDRHKRNMKEDEIKLCIANFGGLIGFPHCCSLFAGDIKSFKKGPDFFRSPKKFFVENIEGLDLTSFLSLAFLFCNGELLEKNLSSETMPEPSKELLMDLASSLHILGNQASITLLRDAYDNFWELYVVKSTLNDFSLKPVVEKPSIMFTHATVSEAVGHVLWKRCCEMVVKYGDSEYLYQRTYTAEVEDSSSENVLIPVSVYGLLAERMVHDVVNRRLVSSVVKHSALKRPDFINILKFKLNNGNLMKDFFMAGKDEFQSDTLSEGKCVTFMQYILQGDKDVVKLVYSELLEMLACACDDDITDCWQCEEMQGLLELALCYHHFEIADKLVAMKACYTDTSLYNAARHGDLERVQAIIERIQKNADFNPQSLKAKYALYRAYVSGNESVISFLLSVGIVLDSWCVIDAVQHGDMTVLEKVVEHLKLNNKWNPGREEQLIHQRYSNTPSFSLTRNKELFGKEAPCFKALYISYLNEKFDMADYLMQNGVKLEMYMLVCVLEHSSKNAAFKVIKDLKGTGTWDQHCDDATEALKTAICEQKYDVYDLLVRDGVSLKMENLPGVVRGSAEKSESIQKVIEHLEQSGNWDHTCDFASEALEVAIYKKNDAAYHLLTNNGISLKMKNLSGIIMECQVSLESVTKVIEHLKETHNWDPECDDASEALETAVYEQRHDLYDLLVHNKVSLKINN